VHGRTQLWTGPQDPTHAKYIKNLGR
jgi:hypothetical protein